MNPVVNHGDVGGLSPQKNNYLENVTLTLTNSWPIIMILMSLDNITNVVSHESCSDHLFANNFRSESNFSFTTFPSRLLAFADLGLDPNQTHNQMKSQSINSNPQFSCDRRNLVKMDDCCEQRGCMFPGLVSVKKRRKKRLEKKEWKQGRCYNICDQKKVSTNK